MHHIKTMKTIPLSEQGKIKAILNLMLVIVIVSLSFRSLNISIWEVITSLPSLVSFFINNFLPPNFSKISMHLSAVVDTILFAVVGTYISAFIGFILGILMAEEMNPFPAVRVIVRFIVSFFRNVPVLIWASLMIYVFGVGSIIGLLALILATMGFLARSYAESINEIAGSKLDSLRASGAGYMQILFHGLIPEFIPAWINWTLYSFEINIRASALLGMVGAGGIGLLIQASLNLRNYREACSLIIIVVAMVLITEAVVNYIRRSLKV